MTKTMPEVRACRRCGTAVYLSHKSNGPEPGGTGSDLNEHWRHIDGNIRHCVNGNGAIAEPYDGGGEIAWKLQQLLEGRDEEP